METSVLVTKNAFQIMMSSRHKVIGSNSPGKDSNEKDDSGDEKRDVKKLKSRKKLFNNWAEKKGAAKRRRDEEDKDESIKHKLKKRAKRMKKLLHVENSEDRAKKRNRVRKLSDSSDSLETKYSMTKISNGEELESKSGTNGMNENKSDENLNGTGTSSLSSFVGVLNELQDEDANLEPATLNKKVESDVVNFDDKAVVNGALKKENKCKKKTKNKKEVMIEESSQESSLLPKWKMRIRIKYKSEEEVDGEKTVGSNSMSSEKEAIAISSESEDDNRPLRKSATSLKLAPVFAKAAPKPKIDPAIIEARRKFLFSESPLSSKKLLKKQQSLDEIETDIFPKVSHVQQKCGSSFWDLAEVNLHLTEKEPLEINESDMLCTNLICKANFVPNIKQEAQKINKCKPILKEIKSNNPSYPVNKSFRLISEKNERHSLNKTKSESNKKQGSKNKTSKKKQQHEQIQNMDLLDLQHAVWTEKYRPKCSDDIVGNWDAIKKLKKWLETWKHFNQELNFRKRTYSSSSDFETTDGDSRDSVRLQGNTLILGGPCGSGKSAAVYGICEELEMNILEVNASSKRTGKKLMQKLQEATQSHQILKQPDVLKEKSNSAPDRRICVLLVEDIDIVFEQDDGFILALNQLINTSKRPIIITTSDHESTFVKKFKSDYEFILFSPLYSSSLATWLQILCLVEGSLVNRDDIGNLLDFNKGDVRKTLLQLQFWVQSGGQLIKDEMPVKIEHKRQSCEEKFENDDNLEMNTSNNRKRLSNITEHKNCIRTFEIFQNGESFNVPYYVNLNFIWWNIPNILNMPEFSKVRKDKLENEDRPEVESDKKLFRQSLEAICNFYSSLCTTDVIFKGIDYSDCNKSMFTNDRFVKDSLELGENFVCYDYNQEFVHELTHTLVDKCVQKYNSVEKNITSLDMGVPTKKDKRWRTNQQKCTNLFKKAIPTSLCLEKKSISLDYLPALRSIARLDREKVANSTKRRNRFRSDLNLLGINCNENMMRIASDILQE